MHGVFGARFLAAATSADFPAVAQSGMSAQARQEG